MHRFYLFVFSFLLFHFLFAGHVAAANNSTIAGVYQQTNPNASWRFTESDALGNRFIYKKDKQVVAGEWKKNGDTITLKYKATIDSAIVRTPGDPLAIDTAAVYQSRLPLPTKLLMTASGKNLTLTNTTNNQQKFDLQYNESEGLSGLLNNNILRGLIGLAFLIGVCFLLSNNRRAIDWKLVASGILIQLVFALLVLKVPSFYFPGTTVDISPKGFFEFISSFFVAVINFTSAGASFLFGDLVNRVDKFGFIFAFKVLPTVIFFSGLSSLLYYIGVLQKIVYAFAWVMSKSMRLSGAESLSAAANIFLGQTEAPLLVKPYIAKMNKSEVLCLMVGGMTTIAGGVFAAYVGYLGGDDPVQQLAFATHLLSASIMSAPAAIVASKMLFPQTENIDMKLEVSKEKIGANLLDAIANGTTEGLKLAVNVGAMLLMFTALIAMCNGILDLIGQPTGLNKWINISTAGRYAGLTLQYIFGLIGAPVAWLLGTPNCDLVAVGQLLGEKTVINEFVAYGSMGTMKATGVILEDKSLIIALYALCGFSNFASIGIQIGGIGALAPEQRPVLAQLGIKALIGGTIACFFTAVIAAMIM
ncbi:MAG: hypothetical protein IT272_02895 [Chitinophagales bacterium]|jgi:CNT family concentrative nucleoside transporter|nr:hypothetical protein [Chitinophagales bacterium]MCC7056341.1 hypothetical protein [Chitinophagales bacterium]